MIVQCENCQSTFNLDDALIQEGGTHVRCSLCKHVFKVYPPEDIFIAVDDQGAEKEWSGQGGEGESSVLGFTAQGTEGMGLDKGQEADLDTVYKDMFQASARREEAEAEIEADSLPVEEDDRYVSEAADQGEAFDVTRPGVDFSLEDEENEAEDIRHTETREREEPPVKKGRSGKSRFLTVFLVIILLILGAGAAVVFLKPQWIPPYLSFLKPPVKQAFSDAGVRLLMFKDVSGSFVESEKAGNLFVIRGEVHNNYGSPRSYILIKGNILDEKGQVIKSELAYAGNTFTDEEMKTLPYEDIQRAMKNKDGMARQNFNIPPGASIPFMVAFQNLPENLSEFTVEAISSSPGA
ncbi:MAG: DUF3426 domain-containing protein [Desulfatiglandaceae bacterium]